jgi:hypothetical protein
MHPGPQWAPGHKTGIVFEYMWRVVLTKLEHHLVETEVIQPLESHQQLPMFGHTFPQETSS